MNLASQSQPSGKEGSLCIYDESPSSPVRLPVRNEPLSTWATTLNNGVRVNTLASSISQYLCSTQEASREGPIPTGNWQRNDVGIFEWSESRVSQANPSSERLDEDSGNSVESDGDMSDIINDSGRSSRGDIDMQSGDSDGSDILEDESDANDIVMEGDEEGYDSGDSGKSGDSNVTQDVSSENGDSKGSSTSASQGVTGRNSVLSSLVRHWTASLP